MMNKYSFDEFAKRFTGLQDSQSIQFNVFLFLVWYGQEGCGRLRQSQFKTILEAILSWHDRVVSPLIRLIHLLSHSKTSFAKRTMKYAVGSLSAANEAERQFLLDAFLIQRLAVRNETRRIADSCFNVVSYFKWSRRVFTENDKAFLLRLLEISFPERKTQELSTQLENTLKQAKYEEWGVEELSFA